ncbi:MAG TPA: hypothetical protein VMW87_09130 [Spirochaetia bacterium]|nr:hypothetical protein [Spirochaetia bacterium]
MFTDARSKAVVFIAHCILNQNSISDGTADYPGAVKEIMELLCASDVGIVQMPCPELICLGLDRGNVYESASPVVEENTRIRGIMGSDSAAEKLKRLVDDVVFQISEYLKYGFEIRGIVGINRSPSCGVETTSKDNREVEGEGVFIETLRNELGSKGINLKFVGIKTSEPEEAVKTVRELIAGD